MIKWDFISSVMIGVALLLFGSIKSLSNNVNLWTIVSILIGLSCLLFAYIKSTPRLTQRGGSGGSAHALGDNSDAEGGAGGKGLTGEGGRGGDGIAQGAGAKAKGGRGGDA